MVYRQLITHINAKAAIMKILAAFFVYRDYGSIFRSVAFDWSQNLDRLRYRYRYRYRYRQERVNSVVEEAA